MDRPVDYRYLLSLPERVVRSLSALSGGLLQELSQVVIPSRLRRTTLYGAIVEVTLRFLIEQVGQVEGVFPSEGQIARNFLLQRTAGHGIELLGIFAFHVSPVWVLAALADVAGGGHQLISEIASTLKDEGLLEHERNFETMDQLLDGLEKTSARLARTLNVPPVNTDELRREWTQLQADLPRVDPQNIPPLHRLESIWEKLRASAIAQDKPVFVVSTLMAVSSIAHLPANLLWLSKATGSAARTTGQLLGGGLLNHYSDALEAIQREGFADYWAKEFRPYLKGAAEQFEPEHVSTTERLLRSRRERAVRPPDQ